MNSHGRIMRQVLSKLKQTTDCICAQGAGSLHFIYTKAGPSQHQQDTTIDRYLIPDLPLMQKCFAAVLRMLETRVHVKRQLLAAWQLLAGASHLQPGCHLSAGQLGLH